MPDIILKITFISVGGIKNQGIKENFEEYLKRIKRYSRVESIEVKEEPGKTPKEDRLKKEGERITKSHRACDFRVVMSERGKTFTSTEFAGLIKGLMEGSMGAKAGRKNICFVTGGPFGLSGSTEDEADVLMALSRLTFPHEFARLLIAEQVYRAFTIIKGEPYSH